MISRYVKTISRKRITMFLCLFLPILLFVGLQSLVSSVGEVNSIHYSTNNTAIKPGIFSGAGGETSNKLVSFQYNLGGSWNNLVGGESLADGTKVRLQFTYYMNPSENVGTGDNFVINNIPTSIILKAETGDLLAKIGSNSSNTKIGTYTVDPAARTITLTFVNTDNVFSSANYINGTFTIEGDLKFIDVDKPVIIDASDVGGGTYTVNPTEKETSSLTKKATNYNPDTQEATWEIIVNGKNAGLFDLTVEDVFGSNQTFVRATIEKQAKGSSSWTLLGTPEHYTQTPGGANNVIWVIKNLTGSTDSYRIKVVTKLIGAAVGNPASVTNIANMTANGKNDQKNDGLQEILNKSGEMNKRITGIDYYKDGKLVTRDPADNTFTYDYLIINWEVNVRYPLSGAVSNPIIDQLILTTSDAGAKHQYVPDSLKINGIVLASSIFNRTIEDTEAGKTQKMTLTPKVAPKGLYTLTYQTKVTRTPGAKGEVIVGNTALVNGIGEGKGEGVIPDASMPGIEKKCTRWDSNNGYNLIAADRIATWEMTFNQNNVEMTNPKIIDSYIDRNIVKRDAETFKWIFFARILDQSSLKVYAYDSKGVAKLLDLGTHYTFRQRFLVEDGLFLPDGSRLYGDIHETLESGFEIDFIDYNSLTDVKYPKIVIKFSTEELFTHWKGYLLNWDDPANFPAKRSTASFYRNPDGSVEMNLDNYYSTKLIDWAHRGNNVCEIHPDAGDNYNTVTLKWEGGQVVAKGVFKSTQFYHWLGKNENKQMMLFSPLDEICDLSKNPSFSTDPKDSQWCNNQWYLYRNLNLNNKGANWKDTAKPLFSNVPHGYQGVYIVTFNKERLYLPKGTIIEDDFSKNPNMTIVDGSVNLLEARVLNYSQKNASPAWTSLSYIQDPNGNELFLNFFDENNPTPPIWYGEKDKPNGDDAYKDYYTVKVVGGKLTIELLEDIGNKAINLIFLVDIKQAESYGSYENTATMKVPKSGSNTTKTDGQKFTENTRLDKKGEPIEIGGKVYIDYSVVVNKGQDTFQQLIFNDYIGSNAKYLKDGEKYKVNVYEAKVEGGKWVKNGAALTQGVDYQLLKPNGVALFKLTPAGEEVYTIFEHNGVIGNWTSNILNGLQAEFNTLNADKTYIDEKGVTKTEKIYKDGYQYMTIIFGPNKQLNDAKDKSNKAYIVEYTVELQDTTKDMVNSVMFAIRDNEIKYGKKEDKIDNTKYSNYAYGYNDDIVIEKYDENGELLDGAKFRLERMNTATKEWSTTIPPGAQAVGEFEVVDNGKAVRKELINGLYRLTELVSPNRYLKLTEPIYFKLDYGDITLVDETSVAKDYSFAKVSKNSSNKLGILKITNKHTPLIIKKQWVLPANLNASIPDNSDYLEVDVVVYQEEKVGGEWDNKVEIGKYTLKKANDFTWQIDGLKTKSPDGNDYRYSAVETAIRNVHESMNHETNFIHHFEFDKGDDGLGGDEVIKTSRMVIDKNGNWVIALKNTTTKPTVVNLNIIKKFETISKIPQGTNQLNNGEFYVQVIFNLYRKLEEEGDDKYQFVQEIAVGSRDDASYIKSINNLPRADEYGTDYTYAIKEKEVVQIDKNSGAKIDLSSLYQSDAKDKYHPEITETDDNPFLLKFTVTNTRTDGGVLPTTGGKKNKVLWNSLIGLTVGFVFFEIFRLKVKHARERKQDI
ncbi:MAG: hypothetical protein LBV67_07725 [Streptococcaceae bacterium]|jgi:hypothetical protein|nr:hypothetical protein [Streptococcaceae bacterium]